MTRPESRSPRVFATTYRQELQPSARLLRHLREFLVPEADHKRIPLYSQKSIAVANGRVESEEVQRQLKAAAQMTANFAKVDVPLRPSGEIAIEPIDETRLARIIFRIADQAAMDRLARFMKQVTADEESPDEDNQAYFEISKSLLADSEQIKIAKSSLKKAVEDRMSINYLSVTPVGIAREAESTVIRRKAVTPQDVYNASVRRAS